MNAHDFYSQFIKPGDLVFDIGANVGDRTAVFLNLGARVLAVEPENECVKMLLARSPDPGVHILHAAVSDKCGDTTLHICSENSGMSSLSDRWMEAATKDAVFGGKKWDREQPVHSTTLDVLIKEYGVPAFIKIDAEGSELEIIRGLSWPVNALSFEFHPQMLDDVLKIAKLIEIIGFVDREYNYSLEETFEFGTRWCAPMVLMCELQQYIGQPMIYGDVYVRMK